MKILSRILALGATLFALNASALDYITTTLNGGTNNVAASTTNSYTTHAVFTAAYSSDIALQPIFKLTGSGTSAVVFVFDISLDGSNWYSSAFTISVTAAGTSTVTKTASQSLGSQPYVRLSSIQNPNASAITNLSLVATMKRGL